MNRIAKLFATIFVLLFASAAQAQAILGTSIFVGYSYRVALRQCTLR